jgi:hypothetical protein
MSTACVSPGRRVRVRFECPSREANNRDVVTFVLPMRALLGSLHARMAPDLKRRLRASTPCNKWTWDFWYKGARLDERRTVADCDIAHNDVVEARLPVIACADYAAAVRLLSRRAWFGSVPRRPLPARNRIYFPLTGKYPTFERPVASDQRTEWALMSAIVKTVVSDAPFAVNIQSTVSNATMCFKSAGTGPASHSVSFGYGLPMWASNLVLNVVQTRDDQQFKAHLTLAPDADMWRVHCSLLYIAKRKGYGLIKLSQAKRGHVTWKCSVDAPHL